MSDVVFCRVVNVFVVAVIVVSSVMFCWVGNVFVVVSSVTYCLVGNVFAVVSSVTYCLVGNVFAVVSSVSSCLVGNVFVSVVVSSVLFCWFGSTCVSVIVVSSVLFCWFGNVLIVVSRVMFCWFGNMFDVAVSLPVATVCCVWFVVAVVWPSTVFVLNNDTSSCTGLISSSVKIMLALEIFLFTGLFRLLTDLICSFHWCLDSHHQGF